MQVSLLLLYPLSYAYVAASDWLNFMQSAPPGDLGFLRMCFHVPLARLELEPPTARPPLKLPSSHNHPSCALADRPAWGLATMPFSCQLQQLQLPKLAAKRHSR